jgi:hypothetical protein
MTMSIDGTSNSTRDDETPASTGDNGDTRAEQAGPNDDRGHRRAETLTREEYADTMRADGPPVRQESPDAFQSPRRTAPYGGDRDDGYAARGPDLAERADTTGSGSEPGPAETGAEGERPSAPHQADADGHDRLDSQFSVVYVDGREVQATHNPADGIWFEGMGEIPNAPPGDPYGTGRAGEVVTSPEEIKKSTYERLNHVLCERFDDITDEIERDTETIQDLHSKDPPQRPAPTFAGTADRSPEISPFAVDHGVDFGHSLEAALVMAAVGAKIVNRVYEKWQQRAKDRHHGSD